MSAILLLPALALAADSAAFVKGSAHGVSPALAGALMLLFAVVLAKQMVPSVMNVVHATTTAEVPSSQINGNCSSAPEACTRTLLQNAQKEHEKVLMQESEERLLRALGYDETMAGSLEDDTDGGGGLTEAEIASFRVSHKGATHGDGSPSVRYKDREEASQLGDILSRWQSQHREDSRDCSPTMAKVAPAQDSPNSHPRSPADGKTHSHHQHRKHGSRRENNHLKRPKGTNAHKVGSPLVAANAA